MSEQAAVTDKEAKRLAEIADPTTICDRLRGIYRIPITDGLGAVGAGDEPNNPQHFVKRHETAPIQHAAADLIDQLRADLTAANERTEAALKTGRDAERLYRSMAGMNETAAEKRAEHMMQQMFDGAHIGDGNRNSYKVYLQEHIEDYQSQITTLQAQLETAREDALALELACEALAANRPKAVYDAMIEAGQADLMLTLDKARSRVRALRASPSTPDALTSGEKNG